MVCLISESFSRIICSRSFISVFLSYPVGILVVINKSIIFWAGKRIKPVVMRFNMINSEKVVVVSILVQTQLKLWMKNISNNNWVLILSQFLVQFNSFNLSVHSKINWVQKTLNFIFWLAVGVKFFIASLYFNRKWFSFCFVCITVFHFIKFIVGFGIRTKSSFDNIIFDSFIKIIFLAISKHRFISFCRFTIFLMCHSYNERKIVLKLIDVQLKLFSTLCCRTGTLSLIYIKLTWNCSCWTDIKRWQKVLGWYQFLVEFELFRKSIWNNFFTIDVIRICKHLRKQKYNIRHCTKNTYHWNYPTSYWSMI